MIHLFYCINAVAVHLALNSMLLSSFSLNVAVAATQSIELEQSYGVQT